MLNPHVEHIILQTSPKNSTTQLNKHQLNDQAVTNQNIKAHETPTNG